MAEGSGDHPSQRRGIIGNTLELILKVFGILIISAFFSIMIEWISMAFFFEKDVGYSHAESMMQTEISYLSESLAIGDGMNEGAISSASEIVSTVVNFLFIDSGLVDMLIATKTPQPDDGKIRLVIKDFIAAYYDYLMAAIYIMVMFFVRMAILLLSMPAFILFGIVGISDGLMQRDLRRWCGGNESGYVYHWAKRFAMPVLIIAWILYLSIPNSIHPNFIITPFAVLFGLCLMVMTSKFKKYL
jgi:integrating conjugative element membrane protein (TIGR03747 family)